MKLASWILGVFSWENIQVLENRERNWEMKSEQYGRREELEIGKKLEDKDEEHLPGKLI